MKRITLTVTCITLLGLTACGGGDSAKKPIAKKDQSNVKPFGGSDGKEAPPRLVEGPDSNVGKKP